jgi:hypothetical protein
MDDTAYGGWLADALEHVPNLTYPLSIQQYAIMRRDPTLAAILSGYTLNIRRATWAVDGTACRPAVVQQVADDLGLPVMGDDTPGAARVRGVSWEEHLRSALLCLTYGHMCHELLAEIRGGVARLVALAERMPHTISEIHVDEKTGALLGISQDRISRDKTPQVKADRLVFYSWEREGASWQGNSLLRPAFGVHLFKREAMRVVATGVRRFSMGVPVVEWANGTNPTPAQITEAQKAASAARVGDTAGASMPPGATLRLIGLTGAAADGMGFLEWLDKQQSRMALMSHLELGQGTNGGSRALGEAFIDAWTLALETVGTFIADQATRQIAARIVEWNYGLDEPVPRVVVSGIGSRREVTAESLKLLLDSKALSADPGLEEWIRREWRLPEREGIAQVAPSTDRVAASAGRVVRPKARRRPEAAGQLALPVMAAAPSREPTELEQAAGVDFAAIAAELEAAQAALAERWPDLSEPVTAALVAAVVAAVAADALADLGSLTVPGEATAAMVDAVADAMVSLAGSSAGRAADELASQGVDIEAGTPDVGRLRDTAEAVVGVIASGYATGAGRAGLQHAGPDADPDAVGAAVREHLDSLSEVKDGGPGGWVATNLGGALVGAQHAGRLATFEQAPDGTKYAASAVNDLSKCDPCDEQDGVVYDSLAEALVFFPEGLGGMVGCLGGLRCRCILVAVTPD